MAEKNLKRLSRKELLELLIEQSKEIDRLKSSLEESTDRINERDIRLSEAGTIADAAFSLNGVFEAVDAAAKQYLENIKRCSDQYQAAYDKVIAEAREEAAKIIEEAEAEKQRKIQAADEYMKFVAKRTGNMRMPGEGSAQSGDAADSVVTQN